jgi:hypothetical protein
MNLISVNSLSTTLDNINDRFLKDIKFSASEKKQVLDYITSRHAAAGSYRNMFAPTDKDYSQVIKLFTGEPLTTRASKAHILSEECCRILKTLNVNNKAASIAFVESMKDLKDAVNSSKVLNKYAEGTYCCAKCTAAYWRNLSSDLKHNKTEITNGLKYLKSMRDGKGRWKKFPYYYTVYSLVTIDLPQAKDELRYTSLMLEKAVRMKGRRDKYSHRRQLIAQKALEIINS